MSYAIVNQTVINETDITTPNATLNPTYMLGTEYTVLNSAYPGAVSKFMYVFTTGVLTQYAPVQIVGTGAAGQEWKVASSIGQNNTLPITKIGIPQVAFTANTYGFVQTQGYCTYATGSVVITALDGLKVASSGTALLSTTSGWNGRTLGYAFATTTTTVTSAVGVLNGQLVMTS